MHSLSTAAILAAAAHLPTNIVASPTPIGPPPIMNGCNNHSPDPLYTNVNSHNVPTAPQTGGVTVAGGGRLQFRPQIRKTHLISLILQIPLSLTFDYSVGVTITLGADLGLDLGEVVKAGIGASVGTTTTAGENQAGTEPCPAGPWECALQIIPTGDTGRWDDSRV